MNPDHVTEPSRREFLRTLALGAGVASLPPQLTAAAPAASALPDAETSPRTYLSFGPNEAAFVEKLVNVMCPADEFTPDGVTCGLAIFIDRQLAGAFGHGDRLYLRGPWRTGRPEDGYQRPLTPEQFFKAGLRAADEVCTQQHGKAFAELDDRTADAFLTALADGKLTTAPLPLHEWFNELVYPLFNQACFADPIYGGNRDKVFWKAIGYPGLPAVNGLNMVRYRGKPFPGSRTPQSIEDFS